MTLQAPKKLTIEGVTELWLQSPAPSPSPQIYRPAVLVECTAKFRSLRAGLNYSEERTYTAWLPKPDLAIDWDSPAAQIEGVPKLASAAEADIGYVDGSYVIGPRDLEQFEVELITKLVRNERLKIFFNPVFGLFSAPGDDLKDFLARVAEAALGRVEPELKRLRNRFELQLEQVREARLARGKLTEDLSFESFISHKLHLFESETRLAAMFSTLAGSVFGTTEPKPQIETWDPGEIELREDLERVEQEASEALGALYSEYLSLANEYDGFEIGLQPDNIQVMRRALLWVPIDHSSPIDA
jgi:hypothetical protein